MNRTQRLHELGQSLWLDNITRTLLTSGTLSRYIRELSVTGLTSNPTIFDHAIGNSDSYDDAIRKTSREGKSGEALFFKLALEDLIRAADLLRPVHDATDGVDGWVSLEVSPLLANDTAGTVAAVAKLHARAQRPNLFIKIPGTPAGLLTIEESIFGGVPVNVTLLFSRAQQIYSAYCELLQSPPWRKLAAAGAQPQRLLWASTGTKDPDASDTIDTIPEKTLLAFADRGELKGVMAIQSNTTETSTVEATLTRFTETGIDVDSLALQFQHEGAQSFVQSWQQLLQRIAEKNSALARDA